jgi:hypothetical protein
LQLKLTPDEAAARAIQLLLTRPKLCPGLANKEAAKHPRKSPAGEDDSAVADVSSHPKTEPSSVAASPTANPVPAAVQQPSPPEPWNRELWADESMVKECVEACKATEDFRPLRRFIGRIWSDPQCLSKSFLVVPHSDEDDLRASMIAGRCSFFS